MIASLIVLLHLSGFIDADNAVTSLYLAGALLIIAELGIVSLGLIAVNGLLALYAAYTIQTGSDLIFGIPIGWEVLFGIAMVEISIIISIISVHLWLRNKRLASGTETMIGAKATVLEWEDTKGSVRFEGEIWKAISDKEMDLSADEEVTIQSINKLDLTVTQ